MALTAVEFLTCGSMFRWDGSGPLRPRTGAIEGQGRMGMGVTSRRRRRCRGAPQSMRPIPTGWTAPTKWVPATRPRRRRGGTEHPWPAEDTVDTERAGTSGSMPSRQWAGLYLPAVPKLAGRTRRVERRRPHAWRLEEGAADLRHSRPIPGRSTASIHPTRMTCASRLIPLILLPLLLIRTFPAIPPQYAPPRSTAPRHLSLPDPSGTTQRDPPICGMPTHLAGC